MTRGLPRGSSRPDIKCVCGKTHSLSLGAMAVVVTASLNGDLHRVGPDGYVRARCILYAFQQRDAMEAHGRRLIAHD
jgi:hypothetical protein